MIEITYDFNGVTSIKTFLIRHTAKSIAFIKEVKQSYEKQPWFYLWKEITDCKNEMEYCSYKRKRLLQDRVEKLSAEREQYLKDNNISEPENLGLKINIKTIHA